MDNSKINIKKYKIKLKNYEIAKGIMFFGYFIVESGVHWALAIIFTCMICIVERILNYKLERFVYSVPVTKWEPMIKTGMYSLALILRYAIMLVIMAYSKVLFTCVIITMTLSQGLIEYIKTRNGEYNKESNYQNLHSRSGSLPPTPGLFSPEHNAFTRN